MKFWQTLLRREEISRYSVNQYVADLTLAYNGHRYVISGGSAGYTKTEDIENSFTGYVSAFYKSNGIVFAITLARMLLFTEARFCWFDIGDNGEDGKPVGRSGLEVLERPWPNAGTGELLARMEQDVTLGGNFYAAREASRLRRLRPDWVTIVLTAPPAEATESDVAGYWYHPGRTYSNAGEPGPGDQVYLPDEICHFSPIPDPDAQYRGMSWLTPVVNEVMGDKAATEHKLNFFRNGATLGQIIAAKENLTKEQFGTWKTNILEQTQGTGNAYRPLFLASPVDTATTTADMKQLDFKVTQGAGETRLCASGGVPPIIVGLSEGLASATYSNYGMARRKFGDHWARPQWKFASTALSNVVEAPPGDLRLGVNVKDIAFLREDRKDQVEITKTQILAIEAGVRAGVNFDALVDAVEADDISLLKGQHSGLFSVQLQPAGAQDTDGDGRADQGDDAAVEYEAALEELRSEFLLERARYGSGAGERIPLGHEGGGRFRKLSDRITAAIKDFLDGEGDGDPLEEFSREQVRKAAKDLGLTPRRGASAEEIKLQLLNHARGGKRKPDDAPKRSPAKKAAPKKSQPPPRPPEGTLADLPEDQRRSYEALLRNAADGGTTKSLGASSAAKQRNDHIDELVDAGYLERDGETYTLTDKGRAEVGDRKAFDTDSPGQPDADEAPDGPRAEMVADMARTASFLGRGREDFGELGKRDSRTAPKLAAIAKGLQDGSLSDKDASERLTALAADYPGSVTGANLEGWAKALEPDPREALRDELDLKKVPELRKMLADLGLAAGTSKLRKRELVDRIVDAQGKGDANAPKEKAALSPTGADGLDELTDPQLASLGREREVPAAANLYGAVQLTPAKRRGLIASLRRKGAKSPHLPHEEELPTPPPSSAAAAPTSTLDESVPLVRDPDGDNMYMHGDSASMNLAQALARRGRNGSANKVMELRRRVSVKDNNGDRMPVAEMLAELEAMRGGETDPAILRQINETIARVDAPERPVPELPANTPPLARRLIEDLNQIPYARKRRGEQTSAGVFTDEQSLVEQVAEAFRDAAAGRRGDDGRSPTDRLRNILREKVHESNDGSFQIWALADRLDEGSLRDPNTLPGSLRAWERGELGGPKADADVPPAADREQAAVSRQAKIDAARPVASILSELDFLRDNEASPRATEHRLRADGKRHNLSAEMVEELVSAANTDREVQVENRIRAAYRDAPKEPAGWVNLKELRRLVGDMSHDDLSEFLRSIDGRPGIRLLPNEDQKSLRDFDHNAAVNVGGRDMHYLLIESPSPLPPPGRVDAVIDRIAAEQGLLRMSPPAGAVVKFDRKLHRPISGEGAPASWDGGWVRIVRPGWQIDADGKRVAVAETVVEEADAPAVPSFDERLRTARQGRAVERLAPVRVEVDASSGSDTGRWKATEVQGLPGSQSGLLAAITRRVRDSGHLANTRLRHPDGRPMDDWEIKLREGLTPEQIAKLDALDASRKAKDTATGDRDIKAIDKAMAQSSLPADVVVWRGVRPADINLPAGDATGHEWVDAGYVGTSADRGVAQGSFAQGALLRVLLPVGTPAIGIRGGGEGELLLGRGLRYRVVADRMESGSRVLDVEVVRDLSVTRSLGTDVTPGNDQLNRADLDPGDNEFKKYWVYGEGRARWNTFTELRNHLLKHVRPDRADEIAASWFHERYGFHAGSDLNRVRQGKKPRGDRVGPG